MVVEWPARDIMPITGGYQISLRLPCVVQGITVTPRLLKGKVLLISWGGGVARARYFGHHGINIVAFAVHDTGAVTPRLL